MPFGEELSPDGNHRTANRKYGSNDSVRQKFTGYLKDDETGLDYAEARMYQNLHGRFTAVDPLLASGKSASPQTFNRYVYVLNNPLAYSDPSGLQAGTTMWVRRVGSQGQREFGITRGGRPDGPRWRRFTGTEDVRSMDGSIQRVSSTGFIGVGWWNKNVPIPSQGISSSVTPGSPDTRVQQLVGGAPAGLHQALHNTMAALPVAADVVACAALCPAAAAGAVAVAMSPAGSCDCGRRNACGWLSCS